MQRGRASGGTLGASRSAPDTPFAAKVYAIFDYRKIGEVDFGEFVAVVWNFCTYTPYTLVSLIFDMYDDDGSGSLDFAEVQKLVRELYGIQSGIGEPRLLAALESLSGGGIFDRSRPIHRDQFETFAIEHPAVVRPALDMQADVRPDAPSPGATKKAERPLNFADSPAGSSRVLLDCADARRRRWGALLGRAVCAPPLAGRHAPARGVHGPAEARPKQDRGGPFRRSRSPL